MDYRNELKKMKKHRRRYRPAVEALMRMYHSFPAGGEPIDLNGREDLTVMLELIDIGYLDPDAFNITTRFGDIASVRYNGRYPLTPSGEAQYPRGVLGRIFNALGGR